MRNSSKEIQPAEDTNNESSDLVKDLRVFITKELQNMR